MKKTLRMLDICLLLITAFATLPLQAQLIAVSSPEYRSDVHGNTTIRVSAAAFRSPLIVKSWLPGGAYGKDSTVAQVRLNRKGEGSFTFRANRYPHGPITVRISGTRATDGYTDTSYLQLYNTGGVKWNEGEPKKAPPAAAGMALVFEDEFNGPLSISGTGVGARYGAHKPDHLDFGDIPFTDPTSYGPFFQRDSYLIIRADANRHTTGLISSINSKDATGFTVMPPYYMECRFIAPNAVGTWPAWWTMTDEFKDGKWGDNTDELDTIEAYGGDGPKSPNAPAMYMVTPHMWGYHAGTHEDKANPIDMTKVGGGGGWAYTPHTYGLLVKPGIFEFYLDDVKVLTLPASPRAEQIPSYFMVNLATGGGWPVDLSRYGNVVDMYVDYIRVYH